MKRILTALLVLMLFGCAGGASNNNTDDNTLRVGMECNYAPFNWTQVEASDTALPISSVDFCDGYDVQIAQYIANKLGMALEIYAIEWDGLIPALDAGTVDAIIAGMSPTAEREEQIDFTDVYYSSNLVVIYKKK